MHARPCLTHLGVYTDRPDDMQAFYTEVLGLVVSDTGRGRLFPRRIIFMTGSAAEHHQFVLVAREPGDPPGGALFQVSFKMSSLEQLRAVVQRALARQVTGLRRIDHGNAWSVYFHDPDRNAVEVYMDTGWHVPQPYADELSLELPETELQRRTAERVRDCAGALPLAEWRAQLSRRLAAAQGACEAP